MKYCPNCGSQVEEGAQFCNICGTKLATNAPAPNAHPSYGYGYNPNYHNHVSVPQPTSINVNAIIGFVLSLTFFPVGLVFSIIGLVEAKKINHGKGYAIAGIIIASLLTIGEFASIIEQLLLL